MLRDLWIDLKALIPTGILIQMMIKYDPFWLGGRFKSGWSRYVFYFFHRLIWCWFLNLIWDFPELSILEVGGWIGDLCNFLFTVFILVGVLGSSMNIFWAVLWIFVVGSLGLISAEYFPQLFLKLAAVSWSQLAFQPELCTSLVTWCCCLG